MTEQNPKTESEPEPESAYEVALAAFKTNISSKPGENPLSDGRALMVLKLAKQLEREGFLPTNKICQEVVHRLNDEIESGQLSKGFIRYIMPARFKQLRHDSDTGENINTKQTPAIQALVEQVFSPKEKQLDLIKLILQIKDEHILAALHILMNEILRKGRME